MLVDLGCDINIHVCDKKHITSERYRKWGIQHFLMTFPSLKLLKYFKNKLKDFAGVTHNLMTPLHLFCKNIKKGPILNTTQHLSNDYSA